MKHLRILIIGLLLCVNAHAQFSPGMVLTTTALNTALATPASHVVNYRCTGN